MIVTGGNSAGDFLRLLGNGAEFGLHDIYYTYQEGEGGIADALRLCEHFADGDRIVVVLGDNILADDIAPYVRKFRRATVRSSHPVERGRRSAALRRAGLRRRAHRGAIEEKPAHPKSRYAVTGVYMYDARVFDFIRTLTPSARGELEIADVQQRYIRDGDLEYDVLEGWWTDAGTFESLFRAGELDRAWAREARRATSAADELDRQ